MIFQNCLKFHSPDYYVYKFRNTTRSIYAKYHYKSCYYLYFFKNYHISWTRAFFKSVPNLVRWLIFNVNVLVVWTWIVTDQFWWIRPYFSFILPALVVQRLDDAIHRIKLYSVDNTIGFPNIYPVGPTRNLYGWGRGDYSREAIMLYISVKGRRLFGARLLRGDYSWILGELGLNWEWKKEG